VEAEGFQAARRRDVEGRVSGVVRVLQSYRRPRVEGRVRVDEGVLRVEELARATEVVNLADPAFFRVVQGDAPLRRAVEASQNPFLQNLMLDVEMELGRGSWLRGQDLDVEMGGALQVFWDRTERDLALVGELQAVRGAYTFWNRQFQVQEGTVSFLGTPGVNPNLNITAHHRMRRAQENDLNIIATLSGTLLSPRVALSSDSDVSIAESDLVSYLIFGAPSYALGSGQRDFALGVAGSLLGAAGGAGANFLVGAFSTQLGSVARGAGLDFLAISQEEYIDPFDTQRLSGTMASTQVEIGQYLTQDVYAALLWRPLTNLSSESTDQFAGLRVEWRLADFWTVEGFYEDPWSRTQLFRPGNLWYQRDKLLGFFFWREWGY
jgi:autotransporter translocation and assembly factor TamB